MPVFQSDSAFPKVKFLTVIWGEKYIERFCSLSLPSFLASGNLPALARATQLEVVIMTRRADIGFFESNLSFRRLQSVCAVRFVEIDDLITTAVYGVTLTLAYARPIIACGREMLDTHFVFMNADFVLANGSLESLARHIRAGRSIVLGPSYRAIAEELEPVLEEMVDAESGVLDIRPRTLVGMALAHPHRTTIAKTFNQRAFSSSHPNQLFWQVDEHTVLGHYFLVFMLCLKPERIMESVNCYCDYSFIPELCPSGDEVAMGDSDNFFMLELQNRTQETFMLRQGVLSPKKVAGSLQEWATAAHRRAAGYDIVFHSKDLPPQLAEYRQAAQETIEEIHRLLGKPKPYQNHHYWVMGLEAWKEYRQKQGLSTFVPELAPYRPGWKARFYLTRYRVANVARHQALSIRQRLLRIRNQVLFGPASSSCGSPYRQTWDMYDRIANSLPNDAAEDTLLMVGREDRFHSFSPWTNRATVSADIDDALLAGPARFDTILFFPESDEDEKLKETLHRLLACLESGGTLHVLFRPSGKPEHFGNLSELVFELGELAGNHLNALTIRSTGNRLLYLSARIGNMASVRLSRFRGIRQGIAAILLLPVTWVSMALAFAANALAPATGTDKLVRYCFGIAIQIRIFGALEKRLPPEQPHELRPVTADELALEVPSRNVA